MNDTVILAVSVDPADLQSGFARDLGVDFRFVPDTSRNLSVLYDAADDIGDIAARQSVLIDKAGVVRLIDRKVSVGTHGRDLLDKMEAMGLARRRADPAASEGAGVP